MILTAITAEASTETFTGLMDHVAQGFEALGAAILVAGVVWSFVLAAVAWRRFDRPAKAYLVLRQAFGGTLLLGLEILVAADLVRTVAVAPTLNNVLVLGLIVVIRTFLSFSLETEIEGVAPWRRALISGAGTIRRASASARGCRDAGTNSRGRRHFHHLRAGPLTGGFNPRRHDDWNRDSGGFPASASAYTCRSRSGGTASPPERSSASYRSRICSRFFPAATARNHVECLAALTRLADGYRRPRVRAVARITGDLRITSVIPCVAHKFKARASFTFIGCCWRSLVVDGDPGTSREHAPVVRKPGS